MHSSWSPPYPSTPQGTAASPSVRTSFFPGELPRLHSLYEACNCKSCVEYENTSAALSWFLATRRPSRAQPPEDSRVAYSPLPLLSWSTPIPTKVINNIKLQLFYRAGNYMNSPFHSCLTTRQPPRAQLCRRQEPAPTSFLVNSHPSAVHVE